MKFTKKKIVTAAAAIALIGGGSAFAYWTTSGSGVGSATVQATAANASVAQDGTITNLFPGGAAQPISFKITNADANAGINVSGVAVAIASVTDANNGPLTGCSAADFTVTSATFSPALVVNANATSAAQTSGASIAMVNSPTNQDACKGAKVNFSFTIA
jgi:hypothetical protein